MKTKTINIYGEITSFPYMDSDISSNMLAEELEGQYDEIVVNINSFGGEVAEGLSIYNQLKNNKARVKTVCNGFACSIASIIFLAGDERIMCENSLLMIHNAWTVSCGNSKELKKIAEDLEKITQQSINIYQDVSGLDEEKIKEMLDNETWLDSKEAMELGFITSIQSENKTNQASQSIKKSLMKIILNSSKDDEEDDKENDDKKMEENKKFKCSSCGYIHEGEEPPEKCPECGNDADQFKEISEDDEDNKEPKELNMSSFFNAIKNI